MPGVHRGQKALELQELESQMGVGPCGLWEPNLGPLEEQLVFLPLNHLLRLQNKIISNKRIKYNFVTSELCCAGNQDKLSSRSGLGCSYLVLTITDKSAPAVGRLRSLLLDP